MLENEVFYISEILRENYSSCSMLKIFPKYFNFKNISKKCIRNKNIFYLNEKKLYDKNISYWIQIYFNLMKIHFEIIKKKGDFTLDGVKRNVAATSLSFAPLSWNVDSAEK